MSQENARTVTTLLLVRHGRTQWTDHQRLQGQTDVPLSAAGVAEARALRPLVQEWAPRTLVVSPARRAVMTAAELSALKPVPDSRLKEADLGDWEGKVPDDIGPDYLRWRTGELTPPGGEPRAGFRERVAEALLDASRLPGPVLVVTHGGVIRAALDRLVGLRAQHLVAVAVASLTVLDIECGGACRLRHYNLATTT